MWVSIVWVASSFLIGAIVNPDLFFRGTHGGEVQRLGGWIINPNEMGMLMTVGAGMHMLTLCERISAFGKFWDGS